MKTTTVVGSVLLVVLFTAPTNSSAEYVAIKFGPHTILLEGRVSGRQSRIKVITHPKFREPQLKLYYRRPSEPIFVDSIFSAPSFQTQYRRRLENAEKQGSAQMMKLAEWTVKHGMLPEFYETLDLVLQSTPVNKRAKQILDLKSKLSDPLPKTSKEKQEIGDLLKRDLKYQSSPHYLLAYDTSEERAKERLELMERVYETFFMFFATKGRVLEKPAERLKVVLFNDHQDYEDFSVKLSPQLTSAAGYFAHGENIAIFYDQGTGKIFEDLNQLAKGLATVKEDAKAKNRIRNLKVTNLGDIVRLADTVELLRLVEIESQDVEVVSHEATHQLAANSGLFPRGIRVPRWVHEGLAQYFEAPKDATWSGVGAVNDSRLKYYRALRSDTAHSNIDFIVSDDIFDLAANHGSLLHAYGQAWALNHFLIDEHFDKLDTFWRILARLPVDTVFSEITLRKCFDEAFGTDRNKLDDQWRTHMNSLKTDRELLLGNGK